MADIEIEDDVLEFSDPCDAIAKAFVVAQMHFGSVRATETGIVKTEKANYSYRYADLGGVLAAVTPALNQAGIAIMQGVATRDMIVTVETRLMHESGQWARNRFRLKSVSEDAQKIGSAITYARRYSALAVVGVAPSEDDDGRGAQTRDESEHQLVALRREVEANAKLVEDRHNGTVRIVKRLIARSVDAEWQVRKALEISGNRTKVWADLTLPELVTFWKALEADFPGRTESQGATSADLAPEVTAEAQAPADAVSRRLAADPDAEQISSMIAWIETKLSDLGDVVTSGELQDIAADVRSAAIDALPADAEAPPVVYDWRLLTLAEMREFWKRVPKKPRTREPVTA